MILCDLAARKDGLTDRQTSCRCQLAFPAVRRRRLLRDGSISRDRLNLDGRRNEIIDVSDAKRAYRTDRRRSHAAYTAITTMTPPYCSHPVARYYSMLRLSITHVRCQTWKGRPRTRSSYIMEKCSDMQKTGGSVRGKVSGGECPSPSETDV